MFKNAIVSVSDKSGIVDFLKPLVAQGLRVLSTGGTSRHLREHNIPVTEIGQYTGFPEVMNGRVRTLHPRVHMALLARAYDPEDMNLLKEHGLEPIDLVVVNLYPFEQAVNEGGSDRELVEEIDIGGPTLLRAAAKNFERITVVCDPRDYPSVLQNRELNDEQGAEFRKKLASKVFAVTSTYDSMISREFLNLTQDPFSVAGTQVQSLRYGENPHQKAQWYRQIGIQQGLHRAEILQGKELSFNNLLDLDAAITTLREFERPAAVAVKHNNACGVAVDDHAHQALEKAVTADPVSVFGGIIACNREIEAQDAEFLSQRFLECVIAPRISTPAREIFAKKKNLRVLQWPEILSSNKKIDLRMIDGGFLVQSVDQVEGWQDSWKVLGREPDAQAKKDLIFAWKVCAHLKSNAIVIAGHEQTRGLGMGQVNRVEAVQHAITRMQTYHPKSERRVLASDAFFPFPDSIELAAQAGIQYIVQPGGSLKDEEVFARARELGIGMVVTGVRHFRH